jgi:hypothetical protein
MFVAAFAHLEQGLGITLMLAENKNISFLNVLGTMRLTAPIARVQGKSIFTFRS